MSSPPELRALCHQIETTPPSQLVHVLGSLQIKALRCRGVLSTTGGHSTKAETTETSVLVHKLRTQIQTLLNDRKPEARLAAVVLIKSTVDAGGWMILKDSGKWIMGLLSILSKPDPYGSKRLCIIALTSIFLAAQHFQSLVREIITPNLPTFVTKSLELVITKSSGKLVDAPPAMAETVLNSFSMLVEKHPAIFRSFRTQIQGLTQHYIAPTVCDQRHIPVTLRQSATRLTVLLHQTAPKNTSGEEWGKGIRELINLVHGTADTVFRAVLEDWESSTGHVSKKVDVSDDLSGDGGGMPEWAGIDAGMERLTGLLNLLAEYCKHPTATSVTIPLAVVGDVVARMLSIAPPLTSSRKSGGMRLHPAVDRTEKEGLWSGLPAVHIASMNVYSSLAQRIGAAFMPLSNTCIEHIAWAFPALREESSFKIGTYRLLASNLPLVGPSMSKLMVGSLSTIIDTCIDDCVAHHGAAQDDAQENRKSNGGSANADSFLGVDKQLTSITKQIESKLSIAAKQLLPLLTAYVPPSHMSGHRRAALDRAAILSQDKAALLASVLQPYRAKTGQAFPSILPHLCRLYPTAAETEALIRPRFPPIVLAASDVVVDHDDISDEDDMSIVGNDDQEEIKYVVEPTSPVEVATTPLDPIESSSSGDPLSSYWGTGPTSLGSSIKVDSVATMSTTRIADMEVPTPIAATTSTGVSLSEAHEDADDSDDSSIALVMEFDDMNDSDSEDEE